MVRSRLRRHWRGAVTAVLTAIALGAPFAAVAYDGDFFLKDGPKNAVLADWVIHPAAVFRDGRTYVVFQGADLDPYAAVFDNQTRTWQGPVKVGEAAISTDMHGAPALYIDPDGYLNVFFGSHHRELQHARSVRPFSIESWAAMPTLAGQFTYPQVLEHEDGGVEVFYRDDAELHWVSRSLDASGTWSEPEHVLVDAAGQGWYANFTAAASGTVDASFLRLDWSAYNAGSWGRRDVYFAHRDEAGVWRGVDGTEVALPVTADTASGLLVYASGDANTNGVSAHRDADGHPCVLFITGAGAGEGSYTWKFAHWDDGAWSITDIATTDHFYDAGAWGLAPEGGLEAFLVIGGTRGIGTGDRDYTDDGGQVVRFWADECGAAWTRDATVSPTADGSVFNAPHMVQGADPGARLLFDEWRSGPAVSSLYALGLYLWGDDGLAGRTFPAEVVRVAGVNRAATAVAVSRASWPVGADAVVIATGADFPDGLCGAPLAFARRGPLLFATFGELDTATLAEIKRLRPKVAYILGGTSAVSPKTATALKQLGITDVRRLQGRSRYDTAASIAEELARTASATDTVVLASGTDFPDALSVSPLAAHNGWPILLSGASELPTATASAIATIAPDRVIIIGGEATVPSSVEASLPSVERYAGQDRYETARVVAEFGLTSGLMPRRVMIASGVSYPDALAGAVLAARVRGPILLSPNDVLGVSAAQFLSARRGRVLEVLLMGGSAALGDQVHAGAADLIE